MVSPACSTMNVYKEFSPPYGNYPHLELYVPTGYAFFTLQIVGKHIYFLVSED